MAERGHLRTHPAGPGSALPSPARLAVVLCGPDQLSANSRVNTATSCGAGRAKRPHRSRCVALLLHSLFNLTFKLEDLNGEKTLLGPFVLQKSGVNKLRDAGLSGALWDLSC